MLRLKIGQISRPFLTGQGNGQGTVRLNRVEIILGVLMCSRICFCLSEPVSRYEVFSKGSATLILHHLEGG